MDGINRPIERLVKITELREACSIYSSSETLTIVHRMSMPKRGFHVEYTYIYFDRNADTGIIC